MRARPRGAPHGGPRAEACAAREMDGEQVEGAGACAAREVEGGQVEGAQPMTSNH